MSDPVLRFAAPDGRRLAYRDTGGSGPAVLCLAGLTRNGRDFDGMAERLAPRFRVVRLDSRGRGASERAEDAVAEYQVPVEAADVRALIDHLGLERLAILGTSRGGILGMALAGSERARVRALILNDVGAVLEMAGLLRIAAHLGRAPTDPSFEAAAERLARENARQFPGVPVARWLVHARAIYDDLDGRPALSYDHRIRAATATALDSDLDHISIWPLFEALGDVPVLLIRGENSDILSRETVEAMRAARPDIVTVEIADRGHAPFLDEPVAVEAIAAFLETHL